MSGRSSTWRAIDGGGTNPSAIAVTGVVGGLAFGVVLVALGLLESVGRVVGAPGILIGVPLLLVASVIGAFVYRALGTVGPFEEDVRDPITGITMGLAFGVVVWVVGVVVLLPLWLRLVGYTPPVPFVHWPLLAGLVVYGGVVGPLAPLVEGWLGTGRP